VGDQFIRKGEMEGSEHEGIGDSFVSGAAISGAQRSIQQKCFSEWL